MSRSTLALAGQHGAFDGPLSRVQRRRLERAERMARRRLNRSGLPLLARICLVVMFPPSGYDKIVHWDAAIKQADSSILPKSLGPTMLIAGMLVEFITPVCIVMGWHDRLAAFVLAGFCVATALLFHQFWNYRDFWTPGSEGNAHFWDFFKNFGLVGGLLPLLIAGKPVSLSDVLEDPLGSAPIGA
jgi:putative oxidoreductase